MENRLEKRMRGCSEEANLARREEILEAAMALFRTHPWRHDPMLRLIDWLGLSRLRQSPGPGRIGLSLRGRSTAAARTYRDFGSSGGPVEIIPLEGATAPANGSSGGRTSRSQAQEARRLRAVDRAIAEIVASHRGR